MANIYRSIEKFFLIIYKNIKYTFFDNYKECISHSIGHFVESFHLAITAFILYKFNIPNKLINAQYTTIFYCILGNYSIYNYEIFMKIKKYGNTYSYSGFEKNIFALFSFIGFYLIPIDCLKSNKLKNYFYIYKLLFVYSYNLYILQLTYYY